MSSCDPAALIVVLVCQEVPAQASQLCADGFVGWQSTAEGFMESYRIS